MYNSVFLASFVEDLDILNHLVNFCREHYISNENDYQLHLSESRMLISIRDYSLLSNCKVNRDFILE